MLVILNPTARGGAGEALRPEIERELGRRGVACEIVLTTGPLDATRIARQAAMAGTAAVVAAGGDGTVHEVANGLLQAADAGATADPALGIIPIGTGNDFVKVLPGTVPRALAYDTLAAGRRRRYDAALVSWVGGSEYCVNAMGTGIDVEVVRQIYARSRRTGKLVYIDGLVRALRRYRPVHIRVEADGEVMQSPVMTIAVTNGTCIGGLFRICPVAVPDDGALDLCLVARLPMRKVPAMAVRLLRGRHAGRPEVEFRRVRQVRIEVLEGAPLYFQVDGELHEPKGVHELTVSVQPGRLHVISAAVPGGTVAALEP